MAGSETLDLTKTVDEKSSEQILRDFFIEGHPYATWYYKQKALAYVIKNCDKLKEELEFHSISKTGKEYIADEIVIRALKFEMFFSTFHITEALFSLILAFHLNPREPWLSLINYKTHDLNNFIKDIAESKMSLSDPELFSIMFGFADITYFKQNKDKDILGSFEFIKEFLSKLAKEYCKWKYHYNKYKHGVALMSAKAEVSIDNSQINEQITYQGDAMVSLENRNGEIYRITEPIDFEKNFRISETVYYMIQNIISIRRQVLQNEVSIKINKFGDTSIDEIFKDHLVLQGRKFKINEKLTLPNGV